MLRQMQDGLARIGFCALTGILAMLGTRRDADGAIFSGLGALTAEFDSQATAVSADGTTVVGSSPSTERGLAFRWTEAAGMSSLSATRGRRAYAVSADGSIIVGGSPSAGPGQAFRWTAATGMVGMGDLPGGTFESQAYGVSSDGSVVVGQGNTAVGGEAFRWTAATGMVGLGDLPGGLFSSEAYAVSADGSVVVGTGQSIRGREAFLRKTQLHVQLFGRCSAGAMKQLQETLQAVLQSALRPPVKINCFNTRQDGVSAFDTQLCFARRWLEAYFPPPTTKDTMQRRLRNAVRLLVQADRQREQGIMLALCFAAIEALVCKSTQGITDELSRNVATLLLHEGGARKAVIAQIRKLYDYRSRVLHGSQAEVESGPDLLVRDLAAGVLFQVFEWQAFDRRMGAAGTSVPEFFDELEDAKVSGRRITGIPQIEIAPGVFDVSKW